MRKFLTVAYVAPMNHCTLNDAINSMRSTWAFFVFPDGDFFIPRHCLYPEGTTLIIEETCTDVGINLISCPWPNML